MLIATGMALLGVLIFTTTAHAYTMAQQIVIGDEVVMVARCGAGGLTAEQRIACINDRLAGIIGSQDLRAENINIAVRARETVIWWAMKRFSLLQRSMLGQTQLL
jgi:hypothetical protein